MNNQFGEYNHSHCQNWEGGKEWEQCRLCLRLRDKTLDLVRTPPAPSGTSNVDIPFAGSLRTHEPYFWDYDKFDNLLTGFSSTGREQSTWARAIYSLKIYHSLCLSARNASRALKVRRELVYFLVWPKMPTYVPTFKTILSFGCRHLMQLREFLWSMHWRVLFSQCHSC